MDASIGRVLWLSLCATGRTHRYADYLDIIRENLSQGHPRCLLDRLPVHLQQDIELATFAWEWRFTWDLMEADEWDMTHLYTMEVVQAAEAYFQAFPRPCLLSYTAVAAAPCGVAAFLALMRTEAGFASRLLDYIGVPFHRCPRCINAFALTCTNAFASYHFGVVD